MIDNHVIKPSRSCLLCGFPLKALLEEHHTVPQSKSGKHSKRVRLCPTCHKVVHRCINLGHVKNEIKEYYSGMDGAVEILESLVKMAFPVTCSEEKAIEMWTKFRD